MENYKGGLKTYWKSHSSYHRLDSESGPRRPRRPRRAKIELGNRKKRRPFWRVKISPKLKALTRIRFNPKRIFARIRDAYVRMMLGFASSGAISGGGGFGYGVHDVSGFGQKPQLKEYDEKMLVQIYRSILAQNQVMVDGSGGVVARVGK